ncbi:MAG: SCO family protein [Gimesia sp.]|nr:SCO family protein [Gimesia sp.]
MKRYFPYITMTILSWALCIMPVRADRMEKAPKDIESLDVIEHLDSQLPVDLKFQDSSGKQVTLGDYFKKDRPVILSMNYSNCPMLCSLQLTALVRGLRDLEWSADQQFDFVSVSIDPKETYQRANLTKQKYFKEYNRAGTADGWHFLTGEQPAITKLAKAIGLQYKYVEERKEYAHPAVLVVCTPDGRISRYLYGIQFPETTLKLALVEASEGKIGSTIDRFLLFCFHYDETSGRYAPTALNIMKIGGFATVFIITVVVIPYWRGRKGRHSLEMVPSQTNEQAAGS